MKDNDEMKEYLNAFGFRTDKDPFPATPPTNVDYWADNDKVFKKIIQMERDSLLFDSSSLYIFWGPYGSGKTFAAYYLETLNKDPAMATEMGLSKKPVETIVLPATRPTRGSQVIYNIHLHISKNLISKILLDRDLLAVLRTNTNKLGPGEIKEAIKDMTSKIPLTLSGEYGTDLVSSSEGYKYLTNGRSKIGKVLDIYSLTSIINVLMQVVLERNRRVVIAIDELENLTTVTTSERLMINDYIRRLYDDNPRGLSLILIFTYDSYDDINIVIEPSIISRKRDVIEFSYPEEGDIEKYIKGCIEERASRKLNEVMESEVLKKIVKLLTSTLGKTITFRKINFEMHSIMRNIYEATGDHPQNFKITLKSFDEIYGKRTEELMNEVRKRQKKS